MNIPKTLGSDGAPLEGGQPYNQEGKSLLGLRPSPLVWQRHDNGMLFYWTRYPGGLRVIESIETHRGEQWLHVSISYPTHIPPWEDLRAVKDAFIGKDREAYIVLPPEERYVNDHPHVLHLWCCIDGAVLPDFRRRLPDGKWTL